MTITHKPKQKLLSTQPPPLDLSKVEIPPETMAKLAKAVKLWLKL